MKKYRRLTLLLIFISCFGMGQLLGNDGFSYKIANEEICESMAEPLECIELTTSVTNHKDGKITMWALDFILNEDAYDEILVSLNPNGPFTESFVADCIVGSQTYAVYIRATIGQEEYNCETVLSLTDEAFPIPTLKNSIKLTLENGTATLTTDMIDYGSFDLCGNVEVSLSKTEFTAENVGDNYIFAMVTDETGNTSYNYISVFIYDGSDCHVGAIQFPDDIEIYDPTNNDDNLDIDNLQSDFNFSYEEVHPYTVAECDDIYYTYTDQVIPVAGGIRTIRTWTALDWLTTEILTHVQTLRLYSSNGTALGCETNLPISVLAGPVKVTTNDVGSLALFNHIDLTMVITDENDNIIPDNIVTSEHIGEALVYEVTQGSTGNSCWAYLDVNNDFEGCEINNVIYPPSELQIDAIVSDPAELTVENLTDNYGFSLSDVFIRWSQQECQVAGVSYEDDVVENGDGSYTITRDFTMVDYILYSASNPNVGTFEFTQTITTGSDSSAPNCNEFINVALDAIGQAELFAEVFIEGNPPLDVLEVSLDNISFAPSVSFNCDDVDQTLTVYVRSESGGNEFNCTSQVLVDDKLAPVVIVNDFTIDLESESDTYTLTPDDIEDGSFDNCTPLTMTASQTLFTSDNWGQNQVVLTVTDEAGNSASATSTVTVLIDGQSGPIQCISGVTVNTDPWGVVEVWGTDFVENGDDFDQVLVSIDPSGPYTESFIAPCGVNGQGSTTVYIQAFSGPTLSVCSSELTVVDNTPPVVVLKQNIEITLQDGTATIHPLSVDNGSFDGCTDITLSLDKSSFTVDDIGPNTVYMTVTDLNGNSNMSFTTIIVNGEADCSLDEVIYPNDIELYDEDGILENLTVENLQEIYDYSLSEVYPYTPVECESIFYSYTDQWFIMSQGYKVIRTWTALDWLSLETSNNIQILKLYTGFSTALACNDLETITLPSSGSVTLWPSDVLEGGPYNYNNMVLTLEDSNGDLVADNLITSDYIGETLLYTVTDVTNENSCWGNILVQDGGVTCTLDGDDLSYPLATIQIADLGLNPAILTPEYLHENYGYDWSEIIPTWPVEDCLLVGYSIEDDYFDFGNGTSKIVRNFTVIDWYAYDPATSDGIWYFTQIINIGIDPGSLICDFLPRDAEFGDCESGHTDADDIEWPSDLAISDYRIDPAELVEYSMVDVLDSEPSFYNTPEAYEATYVDLLVELGQNDLVIGRLWTASHIDYGFTWTYTQTITVDFSEFANLVTVNTGTDRAMPGVNINNTYMTNMQGLVYVEEAGDVVATYEDDFLNGVNIVDLIKIQRHIVGEEALTGYSLIAADVNYDGDVKASDLTYMRKVMLEITESLYDEWRFYESDIEGPISVEPKAALMGIKAGDVDDSALLFGEEEYEAEANFVLVDQLLNKGESYSVPVYLENGYYIYGLDYRIKLDTNLLAITGITSGQLPDNIEFNVTKDSKLIFTASDVESPFDIGGDLVEAVFFIEVVAKENSLLSLALLADESFSFLASSELELIILGNVVEDMIGTGANSEELVELSVFPNPTSEYLYFDMNDVRLNGEFKITVYGLDGQKLLITNNMNQVNVSDFTPGMYYYKFEMGGHATTGKFIVIK